MYCRNCGSPVQPGNMMCPRCGAPSGAGTKFCPNCAAPSADSAIVCTNCGANFAQSNQQSNSGYGAQQPYQNYGYQQPGSQPYAPPGYMPKSKIAAGLLGIFLGCFGVHNFYLGYNSKAVAQLVLTLVSCGIFSPATALWGLIEGIMILTGSIGTDAAGVPLGN